MITTAIEKDSLAKRDYNTAVDGEKNELLTKAVMQFRNPDVFSSPLSPFFSSHPSHSSPIFFLPFGFSVLRQVHI